MFQYSLHQLPSLIIQYYIVYVPEANLDAQLTLQ